MGGGRGGLPDTKRGGGQSTSGPINEKWGGQFASGPLWGVITAKIHSLIKS